MALVCQPELIVQEGIGAEHGPFVATLFPPLPWLTFSSNSQQHNPIQDHLAHFEWVVRESKSLHYRSVEPSGGVAFRQIPVVDYAICIWEPNDRFPSRQVGGCLHQVVVTWRG